MDLSCPRPHQQYSKILLAHGGGGELTRDLITKHIVPKLHNELLSPLNDSAILTIAQGKVAFTTDAYVVSPIFFPGGSIGDLAINGTVNDLAVSGAIPRALSLALIIEEGCELKIVSTIIDHLAAAAKHAQVNIVTGDTKVVEHGKCDQLYICTTGFGSIPESVNLGSDQIKPGDHVIINGTIGDHGMAVMSVREHFEFDNPPQSDTAPLYELIHAVIKAGCRVHFMRDPTRGGVAAILNEIAESCGFDIELNERSLPVNSAVESACALLGLDPLHIANEGKVIMFVDHQDIDKTLQILRDHPLGKQAADIGEVRDTTNRRLILKTKIGTLRLIHPISGEQLPRIC